MLSVLNRMSGEFMSQGTLPLVVEVAEREGVSRPRSMSDKSTQLLQDDRTTSPSSPRTTSPPTTTSTSTTPTASTTNSLLAAESETEREKKYAAAQIMSELAAGLFILKDNSNKNCGSRPGVSSSTTQQVIQVSQKEGSRQAQADGRIYVNQLAADKTDSPIGTSPPNHQQQGVQIPITRPDYLNLKGNYSEYLAYSSSRQADVIKQEFYTNNSDKNTYHYLNAQEGGTQYIVSETGTPVQGGRDLRSAYQVGNGTPGIGTRLGSMGSHKLSASHPVSVGHERQGQQHELGESPSAAPQSGPMLVVTHIGRSHVGEQSVLYTHQRHHHSPDHHLQHHSPNYHQHRHHSAYTTDRHGMDPHKQDPPGPRLSSNIAPPHTQQYIYQKTGTVIKTPTCDKSFAPQGLPVTVHTAPAVSHSYSSPQVATVQKSALNQSPTPLTLLDTTGKKSVERSPAQRLANGETEKVNSLPLKKRKYISTKPEESSSPPTPVTKREVKYPRVDGEELNNNQVIKIPISNVSDTSVNISKHEKIKPVSVIQTTPAVKTESPASDINVSNISQVVRTMSAERHLQAESETKDYDDRLRKMAQMARASSTLHSPSQKHVLVKLQSPHSPSPLVSPSHFSPTRLSHATQAQFQAPVQQSVSPTQRVNVRQHVPLMHQVSPRLVLNPPTQRVSPIPRGDSVHHPNSPMFPLHSPLLGSPRQQLNESTHRASPRNTQNPSMLHLDESMHRGSPRQQVEAGSQGRSDSRSYCVSPGHLATVHKGRGSPGQGHTYLSPMHDISQRQQTPLDLSKPKLKTEPMDTSELQLAEMKKEKMEKNEESRSAAAPECIPVEGGAAEPLKQFRRKRNADNQPVHSQQNLVLLQECLQAVKPDEDGDLPLHIAVVQGDVEATEKLVMLMESTNVTIDTKNALRQTPLHLAVITSQPHLVKFLLTKGASPDTTDRYGNTCVHLAVEYKTIECLDVLVSRKRKPQLDRKNYEGLTALHQAVLLDNQDLVVLLIKAGAIIDATDGKSGRTPLHYATEALNTELVEQLLKHGAKVNVQSYAGNTALHTASERNFKDLMTLLVRFGADPTIKNANHETYTNMTKDTKMANIKREHAPPKSLPLNLPIGGARKGGRPRQSPKPRPEEYPESPPGGAIVSPMPSPRTVTFLAAGKGIAESPLSPHPPSRLAIHSPSPLSPLVTGKVVHTWTPETQEQQPALKEQSPSAPTLNSGPVLGLASRRTLVPPRERVQESAREPSPTSEASRELIQRVRKLVNNPQISSHRSLQDERPVSLGEIKANPQLQQPQAVSPIVLFGFIPKVDPSQPIMSQSSPLSKAGIPSVPAQQLLSDPARVVKNQESRSVTEAQSCVQVGDSTSAAQIINKVVSLSEENVAGSGPINSLANMVYCLPTYHRVQAANVVSGNRTHLPVELAVHSERPEYKGSHEEEEESLVDSTKGSHPQAGEDVSSKQKGIPPAVTRDAMSESSHRIETRTLITDSENDSEKTPSDTGKNDKERSDLQRDSLVERRVKHIIGQKDSLKADTSSRSKLPESSSERKVIDSAGEMSTKDKNLPPQNVRTSRENVQNSAPKSEENTKAELPKANRTLGVGSCHEAELAPSNKAQSPSVDYVKSSKEAEVLRRGHTEGKAPRSTKGKAGSSEGENHSSRLDPYSGDLYDDPPSSPDLCAPLVICEEEQEETDEEQTRDHKEKDENNDVPRSSPRPKSSSGDRHCSPIRHNNLSETKRGIHDPSATSQPQPVGKDKQTQPGGHHPQPAGGESLQIEPVKTCKGGYDKSDLDTGSNPVVVGSKQMEQRDDGVVEEKLISIEESVKSGAPTVITLSDNRRSKGETSFEKEGKSLLGLASVDCSEPGECDGLSETKDGEICKGKEQETYEVPGTVKTNQEASKQTEASTSQIEDGADASKGSVISLASDNSLISGTCDTENTDAKDNKCKTIDERTAPTGKDSPTLSQSGTKQEVVDNKVPVTNTNQSPADVHTGWSASKGVFRKQTTSDVKDSKPESTDRSVSSLPKTVAKYLL